MEQYVNDFSKMALALTSAQLAKDDAVQEHGVGEEIAVHFLAWVDDALIAICQMNDDTSKMDIEERFNRCKELCKILRKDLWCSALTMVSEGYCSLDSSKTNKMDLATAFADPKLPVYECITITHVSIDEDTGHIAPVSMVAAPYKMGVGRKVQWKEVLVYPEKAEEHTKQTRYPAMLRRVLQMSPDESVNDESLNAAARRILGLGFAMQSII